VKFHLNQFQVNQILHLIFFKKKHFFSALWTVIFCHDEYFGFVDYFFLALLIKIAQICMLIDFIIIKKKLFVDFFS